MPRKSRKPVLTENPIPMPTKVRVFGPNLSSIGQQKGTFHVHAIGCADNAHYGPGRKYGGDDRGEMMKATSREDIVRDIYSDHMADETGDPADADWRDYDDLYLAPCVHFCTRRVDPSKRTLIPTVATVKNDDGSRTIVKNKPAKKPVRERLAAATSAGILDTSTGKLVKAPKSVIRWTRIATAHYVLGDFTAKATGHNEWILTYNGKTIATELPRLQAAKDLALATKIKESE
jgi:hypothetical protein